MLPSDIDSTTQWRITWFPPDRESVIRTGGERTVKKQAKLHADWNPIIEKREIVVGEWETVEESSEADS